MDGKRTVKVLDTNSKQCKIIIKGHNKYVIKYPRKTKTSTEYYRSTPEYKILEALEECSIKVPKLLSINEEYFAQEYIEGKILSDIYENYKGVDKDVIDEIIDQICLLSKEKKQELMQYISWNDNVSFYRFYCENTYKVFKRYYKKLKELYNNLGMTEEIFEHLYNKCNELDNTRAMSIIHGDRNRKNTILSDDRKVTFIDWEQACIGDIAYDIAFHLHQMKYTKKDEKYFMEKLKEKYEGNFEKLKKDINNYRQFTLIRSTLYYVYWTNLIYRKNNKIEKERQLGRFARRYNKLCKYSEYNIKTKTHEELNKIFEEYRNKEKLSLSKNKYDMKNKKILTI